MAIASDIKSLFNYINTNGLLTEKIIDILIDHNESRRIFSSGKFPILLKLNASESLSEQRKFDTERSRYYSNDEIELEFKQETYLLTNNIYEEQRDKYYKWFFDTFHVDPEKIVNKENFYFVKLSCPKSYTKGDNFLKIISSTFKNIRFTETLSNIPNKLGDAKDGDYMFLQLGGDNSNKKRFFEQNPEYSSFINGLYAVGRISSKNVDGKNITADFFPFTKPVTKLDLYLYPQFIDNIGCITKGIPNQAGLYDIPREVAHSFLEYLLINGILGEAKEILKNIDLKGSLKKSVTHFYETHDALLSISSSHIIKYFLSNSQLQKNKSHINKGLLPFNVGSFITSLSTANLAFPKTLPHRFISALQTKPFVILTGLSGSGKTKLAEAFSLWISESDSQYCMIAVGADWTNREPLLGFPNALEEGKYIKPDSGALDVVLRAIDNPAKPYFLILDEMNMSHVERYFADFLSAMESADKTIFLRPETDEWKDCDVPATLQLPENLFIIGTVNIDETTYMFSPKVLDRANVLEFRVNNTEMESFLKTPKALDLNALRGKGASMGESFVSDATRKGLIAEELGAELMPFFNRLQEAGAEFGYRTASEISRFVAICTELADGNMTKEEVIDAAIMQKLLPKLHGSRNKIEKILKALASQCLVDSANDIFQLNADKTDKYDIKFPLSYQKLTRMHQRVVADGFTSFAEA